MLHPRASLSVVSQATNIVVVLTAQEWTWGDIRIRGDKNGGKNGGKTAHVAQLNAALSDSISITSRLRQCIRVLPISPSNER